MQHVLHYTSNHILNSYYHNVFYDYYKWLYMHAGYGDYVVIKFGESYRMDSWLCISMRLIVVMDGYRMIIGGYMVVMHG